MLNLRYSSSGSVSFNGSNGIILMLMPVGGGSLVTSRFPLFIGDTWKSINNIFSGKYNSSRVSMHYKLDPLIYQVIQG